MPAPPDPQRRARRRRVATVGLSGAVHAALVAALFLVHSPSSPAVPEPPAMMVSLVEPPPSPTPAPMPKPAAVQAAPATPSPPKAAAKAKTKPAPALRKLARRAAPSPDVEPVASGEGASDAGDASLSEADLAGAAVAGEGGGGGGGGACNMAARLQAALRKDPLARAALRNAVPAASPRAVLVWNGDWVRSRGEDGAGLAAVREAITWEVAFAPPTCRAEAVHGLVLLSLAEPGSARVVVGHAAWRWSDLLGAGVGAQRGLLR